MPLRSANVVGSGPNGLAAAITLARRGVRVTVWERNERLGGACATAELTLPGFHHDLGSSAYPLGIASPFFRSLPLERLGVRWIQPEIPVAHPLPDGHAVCLHRSLEGTAARLEDMGALHDGHAWKQLMASSVRDFAPLVEDFTRPLLRFPSHPVQMATFGAAAVWPARALASAVFRGPAAQALFAGCAGHSVLPLTHAVSSASGVVLAAAAHAVGWPVLAGGGQALTAALAAHLAELGGTIHTQQPVRRLRDLPPADVTLCDTSAAELAHLADDELTPAFRTRLLHFRPGPGIFKLDYALAEPIPWRNPLCHRAGTVHIGGSLEEIVRSEHNAFFGHVPAPEDDRPFLILVQPSLFDPSRAPEGRHTAWVYCHVPNGSAIDRTDAIERQIERFSPEFRQVVLARRSWNPQQLSEWNPNLIGGDVSGGAMTISGMLARPTLRTYRTSSPRIYLCSASTPPGGGVHGMAGHNAGEAAWQDHELRS